MQVFGKAELVHFSQWRLRCRLYLKPDQFTDLHTHAASYQSRRCTVVNTQSNQGASWLQKGSGGSSPSSLGLCYFNGAFVHLILSREELTSPCSSMFVVFKHSTKTSFPDFIARAEKVCPSLSNQTPPTSGHRSRRPSPRPTPPGCFLITRCLQWRRSAVKIGGAQTPFFDPSFLLRLPSPSLPLPSP